MRMQPNVQAFIRRASSMADKTSWTKPLARMAYGDSIVKTAWLEARTVGGGGGPRAQRPPPAGARTPREGAPERGRGASPRPRSTRAQSPGGAAGGGPAAPDADSG